MLLESDDFDNFIIFPDLTQLHMTTLLAHNFDVVEIIMSHGCRMLLL